MRTAYFHTVLLLGLCFIACSHNHAPGQFRLIGDSPRQMRLVGAGISQDFQGAAVSRGFFSSPEARPYLGRFFSKAEYQPTQSGVAVVSYSLWKRAFESRPEIIGSKVELDGRQTIIVGVAAPDFVPVGAGEIWIPKP